MFLARINTREARINQNGTKKGDGWRRTTHFFGYNFPDTQTT